MKSNDDDNHRQISKYIFILATLQLHSLHSFACSFIHLFLDYLSDTVALTKKTQAEIFVDDHMNMFRQRFTVEIEKLH